MIHFSIFGDCNEIDNITEIIGINPTKIKYKKDCELKNLAEDSWTLSIGYRKSNDICELLDEIIELLECKVEKINLIKSKMNLESLIIIVVQSYNNELPIYEINMKCLKFANATNSEIHFDNYIN